MKDLKNFISLNVDEKYKFIEEYGIFIMDRIKGNRKVFLYYLGNIFFEVWILELVDHNEQIVTDIKLFHSIDYLDPYLEIIDIKNLCK